MAGYKITCKRGFFLPYLRGLPELPEVPHLHLRKQARNFMTSDNRLLPRTKMQIYRDSSLYIVEPCITKILAAIFPHLYIQVFLNAGYVIRQNNGTGLLYLFFYIFRG